MSATIVNAAPTTKMLGVQDKSSRPQVVEPEALPTHLPHFYTYAQKGPTEPQLVSGAALTNMYGVDSFDLRKKYATHSTVFINGVNAEGNAIMLQRIVPDDAPLAAGLRLMVDVLPTKVPVYQRNADGSIKTDNTGKKLQDGTNTVDGYKYKFVLEPIGLDVDGVDQFGLATQEAGDQTDASTQTQSVRYPFLDLRVSHQGEYGNNQGLRLWSPTTDSSNPLDTRLMSNVGSYPYRLACVSRADSISTPTVVETQAAEQYINVVLKPNAIDTDTDSLVYIADKFIQAYQDLENPALPPSWGPFGSLHMYEDSIQELHELFYTAEQDYIDGFSDFAGVGVSEAYLFNILSCVSSSGVPYHACQLVSGDANSVRITENTTMYAVGGGDGTMSNDAFAESVASAVVAYSNLNSVLQDTAKYPQSIMYDTGFPLATKYALTNFIAVRKDTAVVLSTHDAAGRPLTLSEESALAVALRTRLQMFPESEYFGTHVMRGMIVAGSGNLIGSQYRKHVPLSYQIAVMSAKYMGASNGKWKSGKSFDMAPANVVTLFNNVNVTFRPESVRNKDWANGLVWVESYERRSLYFPAFKTVYDDDSSVLNSYFTMMACVELQKIGMRVRRMFSGESSLTKAQLVERINKEYEDRIKDKFDNRFVIKPVTYYTKADEARGFSYTSTLQLYAPNMVTVGTLGIESYRIDDLNAA